jgi:hypothetical protein
MIHAMDSVAGSPLFIVYNRMPVMKIRIRESLTRKCNLCKRIRRK